jgi:hypothetical protein
MDSSSLRSKVFRKKILESSHNQNLNLLCAEPQAEFTSVKWCLASCRLTGPLVLQIISHPTWELCS